MAGVQVPNSFDNLEENTFVGLLGQQGRTLPDVLAKVLVEELEDKVDLIGLVGALRQVHVQQPTLITYKLDDVGVVERLEDADFPECCARDSLVIAIELGDLEGIHSVTIELAKDLIDSPIGSLTHFLHALQVELLPGLHQIVFPNKK